MKEVPWFERDLIFGKPKEMLPYFLERLSGTAIRLEEKVNGIPEDILSTRFNNKWSVKENIGHLAEVDEIALKRMDEMVSGVKVMSPAVFEPNRNYNTMSIDGVLRFFRDTRLKNLEKYQSLSESELSKSSLHPRLNVRMTPVDLAWFDAEHDDHHLVKISEIISNFRQTNS